jgi:hypothetical protein
MREKGQAASKHAAFAALAAVLLLSSCTMLNEMASSLANLRRLQFKIGGVRDFRLGGIDISGVSNIGQFSPANALTLVRAFSAKRLPAEFVLEVVAVNPNDGTGGSSQTASTLVSLESRLLIDGRPTITGDIERPLEIPGTGQESIVPIRMSLDMYEFFGEKRYEDLINLVLALGGANRSPSRLALDAQPRVTTPLGPIAYPGRITIVDKEFR